MKTVIGIRWFPRKVETFQQSQHSIDFENVIVYPDGHEFIHRTDFEIRNFRDHAGCFKHWYRVLEDLCYEDAELIGVFSDDVLYAKDWLNTAQRIFAKDPYIGYLDCFTAKGVARKYAFKKGFNQIEGGWANAWGGAYLFRKKVALKLLKHPYILDHFNYEANQQIDHIVPKAINEMGYNQYFHSPSLMKHIGKTSTIGHIHRKLDEPHGW